MQLTGQTDCQDLLWTDGKYTYTNQGEWIGAGKPHPLDLISRLPQGEKMDDIKRFSVTVKEREAVGLCEHGIKKDKIPRLIHPDGNGQIITAEYLSGDPEFVCNSLCTWLQNWLKELRNA